MMENADGCVYPFPLIYMSYNFFDSGEMFDYIVAHRHVPERQACKFFHQIVDGVEVLHGNDITHRDLKPENLLLKSSANGWLIKIVDFGLSNTHEVIINKSNIKNFILF